MRAGYIKSSDYNKAYMLMQYDNALAMRTSLETGMRIGDVLSLTRTDIDGRKIQCVAHKTGKSMVKTISADLAKRLSQIGGNVYVFEGRSGEPKTRAAVWRDVKQAAAQLGLPQMTCHSARKTYAVELFARKGITAVQKELQHDTLDTTMLYAFANILQADVGTVGDTETVKSDTEIKDIAEYIADTVCKKVEQLFVD